MLKYGKGSRDGRYMDTCKGCQNVRQIRRKEKIDMFMKMEKIFPLWSTVFSI